MSENNVIPLVRRKALTEEHIQIIVWKLGDTLLDRFKATNVGNRGLHMRMLRVQAEAERVAAERGHTVCLWLLKKGCELVGTGLNLEEAEKVVHSLFRKIGGRNLQLITEDETHRELFVSILHKGGPNK